MPTTGSNLISNLRILVVEDQALIAEEIRDRLGRLGALTVAVTHSGYGAVEAARRETPDIVLMDIRLNGGIDGIETAKIIRHEADVPIVYVTAHGDGETLQRAKETNPYGYVLKPFREQDLLTALEMAARKHAVEKREREAVDRFHTTMAAIGYGVITVDACQRITFLNAAAEWLTHWTYREALGRSIFDVLPLSDFDDQAPPPPHPVANALGNEPAAPEPFFLVLLNRKRLPVPVEGIANPIRNPKGIITGAVVAFRNVPAPRPSARAIQESFHRFEMMDSLARLAGGIAHEFNNTLAVILGNAQLSQNQESPDTANLDEIVKAANRSASIVRKLLLFSRRHVTRQETIDVHATIFGLRDRLTELAGEGIQLNLEICPFVSDIQGEVWMLEELLLNVCTNACEAMHGEGILTIATDRRNSDDRPQEQVVITISDTGRGMDAIAQRHVFEPFFSTKVVAEGAGLGMAIAYGIVAEFGGRITCRPNPAGLGTQVVLAFPADAGDFASLTNQSLDYRWIGHETVLLFEDPTRNSRELGTLLREYGYHVLGARSLNEGFKLQGSRKAHAIVADLEGTDFAEIDFVFQLCSTDPALSVLFVSTGGDMPEVDTGVHERVRILRGPFEPRQFVRALRELLDRRPKPGVILL